MKIKSIKKIPYSGKVYNFHCTPDEVYFSEGVLVHNCYKKNKNIPQRNNTWLELLKLHLLYLYVAFFHTLNQKNIIKDRPTIPIDPIMSK